MGWRRRAAWWRALVWTSRRWTARAGFATLPPTTTAPRSCVISGCSRVAIRGPREPSSGPPRRSGGYGPQLGVGGVPLQGPAESPPTRAGPLPAGPLADLGRVEVLPVDLAAGISGPAVIRLG